MFYWCDNELIEKEKKKIMDFNLCNLNDEKIIDFE